MSVCCIFLWGGRRRGYLGEGAAAEGPWGGVGWGRRRGADGGGGGGVVWFGMCGGMVWFGMWYGVAWYGLACGFMILSRIC